MTQDQSEALLFTSARFGPGWGNPRTATAMHITRTHDTLQIQTLLLGLKPDTVQVTLSSPHLIIEGTLLSRETRGRYVRYLPELPSGPYDEIRVTYRPDSQLIIEVTLKQTP